MGSTRYRTPIKFPGEREFRRAHMPISWRRMEVFEFLPDDLAFGGSFHRITDCVGGR